MAEKKEDFKQLGDKELVAKRAQLKKQYMDLRFQKVIGHLDNPMQIRNVRRDIARLNTLIGVRSKDKEAK